MTEDVRVLVAVVGVGGVVLGALVAAAAALVTGTLTRRHENRRWLQDKKLEAFVAFNDAAYKWVLAYTDMVRDMLDDTETPVQPSNEYLATLTVRRLEVSLLCSEATRAVVDEVMRQATASATWGPRAETDAALDRMVHFMSELGDVQRQELSKRRVSRKSKVADAPINPS